MSTPGVMLERVSGPVASLLAVGVLRRIHDDEFELFLNPDEATQGGMARVGGMRVPVRGEAVVTEELFSAWLAIPPGVVDGTVLTPTVLLPGMIRPVTFRVRRLA